MKKILLKLLLSSLFLIALFAFLPQKSLAAVAGDSCTSVGATTCASNTNAILTCTSRGMYGNYWVATTCASNKVCAAYQGGGFYCQSCATNFKACVNVCKCANNNACAANQYCNTSCGGCVNLSCASGQTIINHQCVDNCGARSAADGYCGTSCPAGTYNAACSGATACCKPCPAGTTLINGQCLTTCNSPNVCNNPADCTTQNTAGNAYCQAQATAGGHGGTSVCCSQIRPTCSDTPGQTCNYVGPGASSYSCQGYGLVNATVNGPGACLSNYICCQPHYTCEDTPNQYCIPLRIERINSCDKIGPFDTYTPGNGTCPVTTLGTKCCLYKEETVSIYFFSRNQNTKWGVTGLYITKDSNYNDSYIPISGITDNIVDIPLFGIHVASFWFDVQTSDFKPNNNDILRWHTACIIPLNDIMAVYKTSGDSVQHVLATDVTCPEGLSFYNFNGKSTPVGCLNPDNWGYVASNSWCPSGPWCMKGGKIGDYTTAYEANGGTSYCPTAFDMNGRSVNNNSTSSLKNAPKNCPDPANCPPSNYCINPSAPICGIYGTNNSNPVSAPAPPINLRVVASCNSAHPTVSQATFSWDDPAPDPTTTYAIHWTGSPTDSPKDTADSTTFTVPYDYETCNSGPGGCSFPYDTSATWWVIASNSSGSGESAHQAFTTADCSPASVSNYSIAGSIFIDTDKNGNYDTGENIYTNSSVKVSLTCQSGDCLTKNYPKNFQTNNGIFSTTGVLPSGQYLVSIIPPTSYTKTTTDALVTVGAGCSFPPNQTTAQCNGGDITGLMFGINNFHTWIQTTGGDVYGALQYSNIPSNACGDGTTYGYMSISQGQIASPGIIFSGNDTADFGQGQASSNNWLVGGGAVNYPEPIQLTPPNRIITSYDSISALVKTSGTTLTDLKTICADFSNCSLPSGLAKGAYLADVGANGTLNLTGANNTFTNGDYVIMVKGTGASAKLLISTDISVPAGNTLLLTSQVDIHIDKSVGAAYNDNTTVNIEGYYSTDHSFVLDTYGPNNCPSTPDKRLNMEGAIVANASLLGGSLQINRDMCAGEICPTLSIKARPDYVLNAPLLYQSAKRIMRELAP